MRDIVFKYILTISLVSTIIACSNNKRAGQETDATAKKESLRDTVKENYVKFLDGAAASAITEFELYDGFRFDMTKKQFNSRFSKYKKKDSEYALITINNQVYTTTIEGKYLDDKLYYLEFTILSVGSGDYKAPNSSNMNSLVSYFSSLYNDYSHMFVREPLTTGPTHLWKKSNKIVKLSSLYAGSEINSISLEFENYPIIRGISKKMSAEQMKRIREKVEAKKINKNDPVVGMFICKKTNDKYIFSEDGTGYIFTGGTNTDFKWQHEGEMVILTYEAYGKEYLLFDAKKKTLKEDSELYGVLIFNKI